MKNIKLDKIGIIKNKNEIRKLLINKRLNLSKDEVLAKSMQIKKRLFQIDEFKKTKKILFYLSYNGEVFTHDAIKEAFIDKEVVIPISNKKNRSLILSNLSSFKDLEEGPYGILEPKKEKIKELTFVMFV